MKKLLQRRQGFTLIELLIVIVIIGILAVGFAPTLLNAPKKARDGVRKGQIASIQQAVEAYALDNTAGYLADENGCLNSKYNINFQGKVLPVDPVPAQSNGACKTPGAFGYGKNDKCYWLAANMEIPENNNGGTVGADCKITPATPNTIYYAVTMTN